MVVPHFVIGMPWKLLAESTGELPCEPARSQRRKGARQEPRSLSNTAGEGSRAPMRCSWGSWVCLAWKKGSSGGTLSTQVLLEFET